MNNRSFKIYAINDSLKSNNINLLNEISTLKNEKENFFKNLKFVENEHNHVLEKNKSITLEIERIGKHLASKNENFHLGSKILNENLSKDKSARDKTDIKYVNKEETHSSVKTKFFKA